MIPVAVTRHVSPGTMWHVPPIWKGETIVCVGNGPSLTVDQVIQCEGARMIVINDAYRLAPLADILYACDYRWWEWNHWAPEFRGVRVALGWNGPERTWYPGWNNRDLVIDKGIRLVKSTGELGLESEDTGVRTGRDSGYQAINLAVHLGAKRIVLIGYDMRPVDGKNHWFGDHPHNVPPPPFELMLPAYESLVDPLKERGIEIFNCTRKSALEVFPMAPLEAVV